MTGSCWARSRLISRAEATGSSCATLPLVTMPDGREVGDPSATSKNALMFTDKRAVGGSPLASRITGQMAGHVKQTLKDFDALRRILPMQLFQPLVLIGEAALARRVHDW
jgi:hypothetical protein